RQRTTVKAPRALPPCARQATSPPPQHAWGRGPAASCPWVRCEVRLPGRDARALQRPLRLLLLDDLRPTGRSVQAVAGRPKCRRRSVGDRHAPKTTHLVLDYGVQGLPQRRGVGGVWLVFQRPQDTAGDSGNVGVAAPASDGEAVRHLDQVSVRVRERVLAGGFASPSL